jgi:hypothetical protein
MVEEQDGGPISVVPVPGTGHGQVKAAPYPPASVTVNMEGMEEFSDEFVVEAVNEARPKHNGPRVNGKAPEADVRTEIMKNDGNPTVSGSLNINTAPKRHASASNVNVKMEVKQEGFDEFVVSGAKPNYSGPRVNVKATEADGRSNDKKEDGDQTQVPVFAAGNVKTEPRRLTNGKVKVEVKQEVSDGSVVKTVSISFCSIIPTLPV